MDNIETKEIRTTQTTHIITCDKCGKEICRSEEYDDGYWENPAEYEQKMLVNMPGANERYKLTADLCRNCAEKKTAEIIEALKSLGFEKETW